MALHAPSLLMRSRPVAGIELHRERVKLRRAPTPRPLTIHPSNTARVVELIAWWLSGARRSSIEAALSGRRFSMQMHHHEPSAKGKKHPPGRH
jgi:hypothetical protein